MKLKYKTSRFMLFMNFCSKKIPVPSMNTYRYVYEKAANGNEMAAAQILEWKEFCSPENSFELNVYKNIINSYREFFF